MKKVYSKLLKSVLLTFFFLLIIVEFDVNAEDTIVSKVICLPNRNCYDVSWDITKNTAVNESLIDEAAIKNHHVAFPTGTTELEKEKYKIDVYHKASNCYLDNNEVKCCPTADDLDATMVSSLLEVENSQYKNIKFEYNTSNDTLTMKIADLTNGKIKIRIVSSEELENNNEILATEYNDFLRKEGKYFVINNVKPSKTVKDSNGNYVPSDSIINLKFYLNNPDSKCHNSYIASLPFSVPTVTNIKLDNPAITDDSYGCAPVREYVQKLIDLKIIKANSENEKVVKNGYVSMCYKNKINYEEYQNLKEKIAKQYKDLQALMSNNSSNGGLSEIKLAGNVTCESTDNSGGSVIIAESGKWWSLVCTESYSVTGDTAKLVEAGAGFPYKSTFTATRNCKLVQESVPYLKPQCVYSCNTVCTYTTRSGTATDTKAGPNDNFDSCVKSCDGGKYSQKCINSCYQQVYDNTTRKLPTLDQSEKEISFLKDGYEIQRTSKIYTVNSSSGGTYVETTATGNKRYRVDVPTEHCGNVGVIFSKYCDTHDGLCTVTESVGPSGCVDSPYAVYQQELSESQSEYSSMKEKMDKPIATGNYTIKIADSYLHESGKAYTYEISSTENSKIIEKNGDGGCNNNRTWTLGELGETTSGCESNSKSSTVTVTLADGYASKINGAAAYKTGNNRYASFNTSTSNTKLEPIKFNINNFYDAEKKYYTSPYSENVNVVTRKDGVITLTNYNDYFAKPERKASIAVTVDGFGTNGDYSNQVNCFYGVYNSSTTTPPPQLPPGDPGDPGDPGNPGNPGNPDCPDGDCGNDCPSGDCGNDCPSGDCDSGITFIFRPIDLNDNFPNSRNPRWNWTDKASVLASNTKLYSLLNYKILPSELNRSIEEKGYNIYSDPAEVDYDIILTPENLRNIKQYNKNVEDYNKDGSKNYLDYNMECGTMKNRTYCYSNFLDNSNYITYNNDFNATVRKDIAICNNTYNKQCTKLGGKHE